MSRKVFVNGRFYAAQMTGVQRVAEELLRAMDDLLSSGQAKSAPIEVLRPKGAVASQSFQSITVQPPGRLPWIWWEQIELPWRARGGMLLNLCNLAPAANRRGLIMIHDAQIYITPESYSRAFVALYRLVYPLLARNASCVLTVSEYSKRMIVQYGIAKPDAIRVIPNGVDHMAQRIADFGVITRLGLQDRSYVLALASTQAHKNIAVLFKAFEQMTQTGVKLVLIGGAGTAAFEAKGQTVPPNVVFAGRVTDNEMRGLMERALCYACPSLTEGFGLPPLEAMSVGCPAIIAPCGALPEVCGDAALTAGPNDPDAWVKAIERLFDDPALRNAQAAAGIARASQFTWRKSAALLIDTINAYAT